MCGITGTISINDAGKTAVLMAEKIRHRGPDEGPLFELSGNIAMCAVRLSIIDVSHGTQPMIDSEGNIVAQNGEIYNHQALRQELLSEGCEFMTGCDTEVLLRGFALHGPKFVEKLEGIFAISFFDIKTQTTYLFRDYFGVKPLYYTQREGGIEYASEIKAFWYDNRRFEIDRDYLIFNHVFNWSDPKRSLYRGIMPVPPSTYIEIDSLLSITTHTYNSEYTPVRTPEDLEGVVAATRQNLESAVESQIPHEVDWAVLLSGGVDSSILAWIAKQHTPKLRTFSVCSEEDDSEDIINAKEVARFLGTEHTEIRVNSEDALRQYKDYLYTIEDVNSRFYFYYFIAQHLKGKVKVALCGEGSDELYMGYPVYRDLDTFLRQARERWQRVRRFAGPAGVEIEDLLEELSSHEQGLYRQMISSQMPWFQLNPVDKCSMRFGVEFRVPYLSLLHALPVMYYAREHQLSGDIEKNILRAAFRESNLPTITRKKYFAGTRTLPTFYAAINERAHEMYDRLTTIYPVESEILSLNDLYALSLIDEEMRTNTINMATRSNDA